MRNFRYQNVVLTISNGATANQLQEQPLSLDPAYNRITGIQANVINSATLSNNLLIGARTNRSTSIVDLIPVAAWNANDQSGVDPDNKFLAMNVGYGSGDKFYAQAQPLSSPGADVVIYMTLRLEADLTEVPRQ